MAVYYKHSFSRNIKSLSIKMGEVRIEQECARGDQSGLTPPYFSVDSQVSLVKENTCIAINCMYSKDTHSQNFKCLSIKMEEL